MDGNPEDVQGLPIPPGCGSHPHYIEKCVAEAAAKLVGNTPDYGIEVPPPEVDNSLPTAPSTKPAPKPAPKHK